MNKKSFLLFSVIGMILFAAVFLKIEKRSEIKSAVVLNEVCSSTMRTIRDGIHDGSDYIELYNRSEETVSLSGWHLSDDESDLLKYTLQECEIGPGEYYTVYSESMDSEATLSFGITYKGEKIFLSDQAGNLVDSVAVPQLSVDSGYARVQDGAEKWAVKEPTPNASNDSAVLVVEATLEGPQFSQKTGFYEEEFYLTLEAKKGETIYYTLDGSVPDESDLVYTEPILIRDISGEPNRYVSQIRVVENWKEYEPITEPVDKATVVRAIAVNHKGEVSSPVTETYYVNLPEYEDMTVINLTVEPDDLFGEAGIFATGPEYDEWYENGQQGEEPVANFMKRGKAWEVLADMDVLEAGELTISQNVGLRAQGNSGRQQAFKRISLFSREEYSGNDYFDESFLDKKQVHSVMINEYVSNFALPRLVEDRDVGIQKSRVEPVAVFINGEYWYTRYVMEKYNRHYLAGTYGVDEDNVIIFKNNAVHTGEAEHEAYFRQIQAAAIDPVMTPDEKYDTLCQLIDMQSFMDFFSINLYLCNMNMNEQENYVLWRTIEPDGSEYGDTRWRWLIYDVECVESLRLEYYQVEERAAINSFSYPMDWIYSRMNENTIFAGLKECERFREQFIKTFLEIANDNFAVDKVEEILSQYGESTEWLEGFFLKRKDYMIQYLAEEFQMSVNEILEMQ